ncbi:MAG TPA: hypothetical protein VNO54_26615 [Streptosporangiaceae bacterium]|nr:hypothetical protein [Streptosporangiaceae bacterium]
MTRGSGDETRWAALTAGLATIIQPALVASGHRDIMAPTINSYILAQHIPDAQLITYPDSGTASCSGTPACSWPTSPASPAPTPPSPEPAGLRPNHTARPLRQRAEKEPNMNDLLDFVLDAHGGLNRWSGVSTLTAKLAAGGPFWGQQGFPDAFGDETLTIDTRRQHAVFTPWTAPGQSLTFDTDPERVVLQDASGQAIARRTSPRSSSAGRDPSPPWDALQVGYFPSYGLWNYLTTPFLLTYPGIQAREISPWQEDGQTWRRLHATFPASITTHTAGQVFYFGADGLLRRLDYTTEVNAGDPVAHYTEGYKTFDGLTFPTRRRVYRRNPGSTPDRSPAAITLDIHDITAA